MFEYYELNFFFFKKIKNQYNNMVLDGFLENSFKKIKNQYNNMVLDGFLENVLLRIEKHIYFKFLESFIYKGSWRSMDIAAAS